ncbi:replicative DNA helicase [Paenibacillus sp. HWE-109]|uniref:replicative DNA helicase n=1 Tax=Paenibacillus sp. HWE-109 TaxID=1306526 RepID=UPI001EDE795E|nr:replicative DNA helicase [Paenibacillus sp. HWE-109]UKS27183.1 replicative DNA helicase [Paenibacillus sp. HWE-109]
MQEEMNENLSAEQAVLGAIFIENESISVVSTRLVPDDFLEPKHRIIYESMIELYDAAETDTPVDLLTVMNHLLRRQQLEHVGGIGYLSELSDAVPTAANVDYYAKLVLNASLERKTRSGMQKIFQNNDLTAEEMAAQAQIVAEEVAERSASKKGGFKRIDEVSMQVFEQIEKTNANPNPGGVTGISSGFVDLDKQTSGFQRQDLIIVGARPSVGKTALALNVARSAGITSGESIAVFSLEMGAMQLVQRMLSAEGNIDASCMRSGIMEGGDWEKLTGAISELSRSNVFIDDSPSITVNEIRSRCRQLKKDTGSLGMILIDYLQLISGAGRSENRQQEISKISRTLKQIARELDVPIIALSQLSRGVEQRSDKRPMMSDLRESGSIEQDADIVAFLYRDDYYDKESEKKNIIEIIIAKQRNGPVGTVELAFLKQYNKFVNLDRTHHEGSILPDKKQTKNPWKRGTA